MRLGTSKEYAVLIKQAAKQGWSVTTTGGNHLKWVSPTGEFFFTSLTSSDKRSIQYVKRDLRLRGFIEIRKK
jgi:hypothetical protein